MHPPLASASLCYDLSVRWGCPGESCWAFVILVLGSPWYLETPVSCRQDTLGAQVLVFEGRQETSSSILWLNISLKLHLRSEELMQIPSQRKESMKRMVWFVFGFLF